MNRCIIGDCRDSMRQMIADGVRAQMCVSSPPYWGLRDYGVKGQIGLEPTIGEYIETIVGVFRLVRDLLDDDGTLWLNLGDSYNAGSNPLGEDKIRSSTLQGGKSTQANSRRVWSDCLRPKNLIGIPWHIAFALQADGWYLRQDIIWHKPNPKPESVTDRCTKAHEYLFLLSRSEGYYYNAAAIAQPAISSNSNTRNRRSVWTIATSPYAEAHFAVMPPALVEPCILAGSRVGDVVFDPFFGSGTVGEVAQRLGRKWIGCDLQPAYAPMQDRRTAQQGFEL